MIPLSDGPWPRGLDSLTSPENLQPGFYQWSVNTLNKGGIVRTRPGFRALKEAPTFANPDLGMRARGMAMFIPRGATLPVMVLANGTNLEFRNYPYTASQIIENQGTFDHPLPVLTLHGSGPVNFEVAVKAVTRDSDGNVTVLDSPYPLLMITDGVGRTIYWDGVNVGYHDDLICTHMKWIGNRLWAMQGNRIRISDLLDPLTFSEEDVLAEGGFFTLPDRGTGFAATPDFRSLLAFTDFTTTAFQAGILNRAQWQTTPDFQKVIFSSIGCAAPRTIVNQFGLTWWMSHNGLTALDSALQTYRSSKVSFKDRNMSRSIANLSDDISGACAGTFGNYLMLSVPSGDIHNYYTWIMDESVTETLGSELTLPAWPSVWTGIRPVQWVSTNINGKARCFAYSNDTPPASQEAGLGAVAQTVWETFMPDSRDIGYKFTPDYTPIATSIPCYLETRLMGDSPEYKKFSYAEIEVGEITDSVDVKIYYSGKRGLYKLICEKTITASRDSVSTPSTTIIPVTFENWIPQRRAIATVSETLLAEDLNPSIEKPYNRSTDRAFSLLVQWTGQMAIHKICMYLNEEPKQKKGIAEIDEVPAHLRVGGEEGDGGNNLSFDILQQSCYINPTAPRWFEEQYHSLT